MQKKTIKKVIENKVDSWIETIQDSELKKVLKDNVLVTGGCIASMFLKEQVNDFDVYIKSKEVLLKLTQYYTRSFQELQVIDGDDKPELHEDQNDQYSVAINNTKSNQVKIFIGGDKGGFRTGVEKENKGEFKPLFFSPNAISLTDDLQIVIRFNGSAEEIHKTFDFIHATNYWDNKDGLVTNIKAMESLITKQLHYQGSLYPITSIIRTKKFIKRNWNMSAGEYLKMAFQVSELDLKDINVLEDQLIGVDVAYFSNLISALRNIKDKEITSLYLVRLIDKIFG